MVIKGKVDTNEYHTHQLSNGISVLIVRNEMFTNSSCALSVGVGSYDEPDEFLGLAHFLEHMLFMGTEKYPNENGFTEYLNLHNGRSNAFTSSHHTIYFFEIESSHFETAADMLANFFISPLLRKDSVEREVCAVNSEYEYGKATSVWQKFALKRALMREDRVESRFNCGNHETLNKEGVLEAVRDLWKMKYSSDIMNLVICGNAPVEELMRISSSFEGIPNRHLKRDDISKPTEARNITEVIFKPEHLSNVTHFKPLEEKSELIIHTMMTPMRHLFKANAPCYVESQLTTVEEGGLLAQLKDMGLASNLDVLVRHLIEHTAVEIKISLTTAGFDQYMKVISTVHEFISGLEADEYEYERQRKLAEIEFAYKPTKAPAEMAVDLAVDLLYYPVENVLNYNYLYEEFNSKLINAFIESLADMSKWVILLSNTASTAKFDKKERFYNVDYGLYSNCDVCEIKDQTKRARKDRPRDKMLQNLDVIQAPSRYLRRSVDTNGEVNLVFDSMFKIPKVHLQILFTSDDVVANPLIYELYFETLVDMFCTKYGREMANYHLSLCAERVTSGISVNFDGFSEQIAEMAKLFFTSIPEWTSLSGDMEDVLSVPDKRFGLVRQRVQDGLAATVAQSPFRRLFETYTRHVASLRTSEELLEQVKSISKEQVRFRRDFNCKIVAVGNIEFGKIEDLLGVITSTYLKGSTARPAHIKIGNPARCSFVTSDKVNNAIAVVYPATSTRDNVHFEDHHETNDASLTSSDQYDIYTAVGRLIHQVGNEKFFNQLRTKEKLGYVVFNVIRQFQTAKYLEFVVQSEKTVSFLEERVLRFVAELKKSISELSEEDFSAFKSSLIASYEMPVVNLKELNKIVLNQYFGGKIDLDYNRRMINVIKKLTVADLLSSDIWDNHGVVNSVMK